MSERKVAVIGAGPCGLAACKTLAEFGIAYECLEASDEVGGVWNVERGPGGGYRSLQTNTSIGSMSYSDFPFEDPSRPYRNASEMTAYFRAYARSFRFEENIHFGERVVRADPLPGGGWKLAFSDGQNRDYGALIVATGQYTFPRQSHDTAPGEFAGHALHAFDYLDPSEPVDCRGKRVIVVGLGSSGAELATELCDSKSGAGEDTKVILSARSGRWVLPKMIDGVPMDRQTAHPSAPLPAALRLLPGDSASWAMRRMLGKVLRAQVAKHGGARALGLPEPEIAPWEDRPTLSMGFIPALQAGKIDVRPGISRFDGTTVHFTDGSQADADVILYATGYQLHFPYFDPETLGSAATELALYQRIAHPVHDDLFFLGCCRVMCSMWPLAEQQSRWVARLLTGAFELPAASVRAREAVPLASTLPVMCGCYVEGLRSEAGGL